MQARFSDYVHLHFIVFIWGFTAILGKLITLPSLELVVYRTGLAAIGMALWLFFTKGWRKVSLLDLGKFSAVGLLIALHWFCFFESIKISNVSVAVGGLSCSTLFTSFMEPMVQKRRIYWPEVILGIGVIFGLYLITQYAFDYLAGILLGIAAGFFSSMFGVFNKQLVAQNHPPPLLSFYEVATVFLLLSLVMVFNPAKSVWPWQVSLSDWAWLLLLAWACTTYAFIANVYLLRRISAFAVALAVNLEPIYSIILAWLIFKDSEQMNAGFYAGAFLIILSVFIYPWLKKQFKYSAPNPNP
ncbi:MAG: DMT family transporter [Sphingobacteriales bacterium]|jgi:drug/metabolite transporter (DMT)-like permease|nr:DMT family transporter [Sphingobacteriales bacterium]MBP9142017.1 DMT family transporter [Chitinophagales bacterium]MDA0197791.1 DMT family transporter [Bacteroidota bacterium]MBK6888880.1 DMT family transporter [Sphingobacteriales bacterium]MBK7528616.1 DMT family transporter [Sphingobacteriales bacterium]